MDKPKVVITRRIPDEALEIVRKHAEAYLWDSEEQPIPREVLLQEIRDAAGILANVSDRIDKAIFEGAPRLRVVSTMAVGYDNIDTAEATNRKIPVGHTPGVLTETTADLTFALLMATARRIVEAADFLRDGKWKSWAPMLLTGPDVYGATIGIIGMGRIGEAVAKRAAGFGMKILYHNRTRRHEIEERLNAQYRSLENLLRESDFVVLLAPSTPETYRMMGRKEFDMMKPSAIFINTSRGQNVDERALYEALKDNKIWAAGIDVFEHEPAPPDHPLLSLPNITALPHIGSASIATRTAMAVLAAKNLAAGLAGEKLLFCANPIVYND
ncbi:2-hydroxyacid dehydrogenase [Effusibacillus lacus]|uniref:D-glycerate dehydrogenase n=1 Tax=Effusibacillus lacus TaxID=1348429 RepID=A0A292YJ62_9BACL|nr:D-glycerate dehydrogenase [Effusibacillus lacus]TCS74722.1 glyoxylate reductase [Effusibacillus lacus]GAX88535.1 D-glycerate dehydrogenase [Effusibacillus lacus]